MAVLGVKPLVSETCTSKRSGSLFTGGTQRRKNAPMPGITSGVGDDGGLTPSVVISHQPLVGEVAIAVTPAALAQYCLLASAVLIQMSPLASEVGAGVPCRKVTVLPCAVERAVFAVVFAVPAMTAASAMVPSWTETQVRVLAQYQGLFLSSVSYQMSPKFLSWLTSAAFQGAAIEYQAVIAPSAVVWAFCAAASAWVIPWSVIGVQVLGVSSHRDACPVVVLNHMSPVLVACPDAPFAHGALVW